ncbi:MAG TPA: molybdopterin cofactor-binding domain-containing protein [Bryobacteraceae bacterium]|nr:molybdopterin cofactor-binding domain-containing protein [Bryobacteraceae bacterium]
MKLEPERYELFSGPAYEFAFGRRGFFKALGGGIVVVSALQPAMAQESGGARGGFGRAAPQEIGAWLHIDGYGAVTVFTGKVEVGQNARTNLTQAVAEELGAPVSSIEMVMGDTERTPFDMGTFGSMTTPQMVPILRRAAAAARELLPAAAWDKIDFAEVAKNPRLIQSPATSGRIKPASEWRVMGTPVPKIHAREMVTGRHKFTSDMKVAGMLHGRVLRPERFNATLVSFDGSAAQRMGGVTVVRDGDFAGVAAPTPAAADEALGVLKAEWKADPQASSTNTSAKTLFSDLKRTGSPAERSSNERGSVAQGLAQADKKHASTYTIAYIAHAPLEPRAAVAEWNGDKLTVWTGTQRPFGVQGELAQAFHIPEQNVRVIMPDTGSGYGGKHTGETAIEAARLAKAAGKPVKIVWTREEEFTWAYFRPAGVIEVRSGVDKAGRITAWEFHNYNSGPSAIGTMYNIANTKIEFHPSKYPLRQGSYRGLAATANHFARESHMDELAALAGIEPLEFRMRNLKNERFQAVLEAAAGRFGWGKRKPGEGVGFGIAGGFEKNAYVAACAEVRCEPGKAPRVVRVVESFECGAIVNPDHLKNQVEGAMVQGLGGALFEAIDFADGKIVNPRFSSYRVPRFGDLPEIDVVLVNRKDLPSAGAGETPIVTIAPAIANAIFAATGERIRSMPLNARTPANPVPTGAAAAV